MPQMRIYAFTDDAGRQALAMAENSTLKSLQITSSGRLHALSAPEPVQWPWQDPAQAMALRLVNYHRVLGELVKYLPKIIPASFESVFEDANGVGQVLFQHAQEILELLLRYGHLRQFSLSICWNTAVMQQLMQRFPKAAGASSLEKERRILRDQILAQLQGRLRDLIIMDEPDGNVVLHAILLAEARGEDRIAEALQRIDSECQGRLHIRLVGPLPACNFARVEVKLPDRALVRRACQDLGIGFAERLSAVKEAYRRKVKALHPDRSKNKKEHELMVRLTRSYRYLNQLAAQQNLHAENNPDKQWLRCDRRTLRKTPLLNIQRGITRWDDALIKRV
ncbi:MAG: GvpL/GvpF family gas vesicle protein [Proteobacteria bacterium]|nr:GvpL/GvpF family gas vesicle protein [Pseudomonadota bacterium]